MTEVTLPSGAILQITLAPWADADDLIEAIAEETKTVKIDGSSDTMDPNFIKDIIATGLSSKRIKKAIAKCMQRATYRGLKINADTWEPEDARGDYYEAMYEVAKANIAPFVKSASVRLGPLWGALLSDHASKQEKTSA